MLGALGRRHLSARLFGAADALLAASGMTMEPRDLALCDTQRANVHAHLGPAFAAAYQSGRALPAEPALIAARQAIAGRGTVASAPGGAARGAPHGLTPRELDVLRRLAEGATDREIAADLHITYRTTTSYVTSILNKLGLPSRTAAATFAVRHGLV